MAENGSDAKPYDMIVIGAGPGGYVCAIRAAQLGMKVGVVEKSETLGGTCLNIGCIPSKALLQSSHLYAEAKHGFGAHGIEAKVALDLGKMLERKTKVVGQLTDGVAFLFKKNKIDHIKGHAKIAGAGKVQVGDAVFEAKHIVIATGSDSMPLKGVDVDEKRIVSSTGALELERFQDIWSSSAPAISVSKWVRCGAAWARR